MYKIEHSFIYALTWSMAITASIFRKIRIDNCITLRCVRNFTEIGQEIWKVELEIYVRDGRRTDFHET